MFTICAARLYAFHLLHHVLQHALARASASLDDSNCLKLLNMSRHFGAQRLRGLMFTRL